MDRESLATVLEETNSGNLESGDLDSYLRILEAFECWVAFNKLIRRKMAVQGQTLEDFLWLFRIQLDYLEDKKLAARTCVEMVKSLNLTYEILREKVLDAVAISEDFSIETEALQAVYPELKSHEDQVGCLERLCFIYEKKKYEAELLTDSFQELIQLDPNNIKALKYFKAIHFHHRDFDSVVKLLERLHKVVIHPTDKSRVAMEWASTCLYQLNEPEKAIEIVAKVSQNSRLDTSTLTFEAHYQLQHWQQCLVVLEDCMKTVESDRHLAVLFFKIGEIKELLGFDDDAKIFYENAMKSDPLFLEPIENLVDIFVKQGDWTSAMKQIGKLAEVVTKPRLKEELDRLKDRIGHGFKHVS